MKILFESWNLESWKILDSLRFIRVQNLLADQKVRRTFWQRLTMATKKTVVLAKDRDSIISLHENVICPSEADSLLIELSQALPWNVENDNWGPQSRATCYFGDKDCVFSYVGLRLTPRPWTETLQSLRIAVAKACGLDPQMLTACLVNHYPTGEGYIPWHYDEIRAHGPEKIVASLSIGGPRRFRLRTREDDPVVIADRLLPSGSVLLMRGNSQEKYEHCLPLMSDKDPHRISFTFRSIVPGFENDKSLADDQCCTAYQEGE